MSSQDNLELYAIQYYEVNTIWHLAAPFVESALVYAGGKYSIESVHKSLLQRDMQLWAAIKPDYEMVAVCVTEIVNFPCKKILTIFASAGVHMNSWLDFLQPIIDWGKSQGCEAAEVHGRKGWERVLAKFGFEIASTVLSAKL